MLPKACELSTMFFCLIFQFHRKELRTFAQQDVEFQLVLPDIVVQFFKWDIIFHINIVKVTSADDRNDQSVVEK